MSDECAGMPCYQRIWRAPRPRRPHHPGPLPLRKYASRGKRRRREQREGDVLRQVASTKGTGHSPTPGHFVPRLEYLKRTSPPRLERVISFTGAPAKSPLIIYRVLRRVLFTRTDLG